MKIKFIAACIAACATVPAFAAPLTGPFDTPDVVVYLSGASAPDNFLTSIATGLFNGAQGTAWYAFSDNTTSNAAAARAYFGEIKAGPFVAPGLVGKKVMLIKRSAGGSVFGVVPVARSQALAALKVTSAGCSNVAVPAGFNYKCPVLGTDPGLGAPTGDEKVPDFGVSDVNPALFKGPLNVEFGQSELNPSEVSSLNITGVNGLAMGLAVTNAIPATTHMSKAVYGSLLSANIGDWTQVDSALAPAAGSQVIVCRRVPGSGTQTSYNWFFNNFPCAVDSIAGSGATTPARMSDSASGVVSGSGTTADPFVIDPSAGYTVLENAGSGDVRNCLTKASAGGVHTFKDEEGKSYKVDFGTGGYGAVGVLSVDSLGSATAAATGWSFRAIDGAGSYVGPAAAPVAAGTGIHPTKANLVEGKYEFASEVTMQYLATLSGLKKDVADAIIARAGDPAYNTNAWVVALPGTLANYVPAPGNNVAKATRNGNMCAPLQRLY